MRTYADWVAAYDTLTGDDLAVIARDVARFAGRPRISVVMPVYDPPAAHLRAAIESVLAQAYPDWELCIADDASTQPHVRPLLADYAARDPRIKLALCARNGGIAEASNAALGLATGAWAALLDHDDRLAPHALYMVAKEALAHPDAELLYSDEDKIDDAGRRAGPVLKTGWDPDLMLAQNIVSHLGVYRTETLRAIGGFRAGFEGSQDWDLALRVAARARADQIRHIPHVLYHWRHGGAEASFSQRRIDVATESARRCVGEHLSRQGVAADVSPLGTSSWLDVRRRLPSPAPAVTAIVPARSGAALLARCVDGLLARTDYPGLDIVILDDGSVPVRDVVPAASRIAVLAFAGPAAEGINQAVAQARSPLVAVVNDNIDVANPDWLAAMVPHAVLPEVGAVGAKILAAGGAIAHAGYVLGIGGVADHAFRGQPAASPGYLGRALLTHGVAAVAGAGLVVRRDVYRQVGGLDARLQVAFHDVDLCLRLGRAGYRVVWTPHARLVHQGSAPPGSAAEAARRAAALAADRALMHERWGAGLRADPCYNPNLTLEGCDHALAFPPRAAKPWRALS